MGSAWPTCPVVAGIFMVLVAKLICSFHSAYSSHSGADHLPPKGEVALCSRPLHLGGDHDGSHQQNTAEMMGCDLRLSLRRQLSMPGIHSPPWDAHLRPPPPCWEEARPRGASSQYREQVPGHKPASGSSPQPSVFQPWLQPWPRTQPFHSSLSTFLTHSTHE